MCRRQAAESASRFQNRKAGLTPRGVNVNCLLIRKEKKRFVGGDINDFEITTLFKN